MGNSTFRSDVTGLTGNETITGFAEISADILSGPTSGATVIATDYVKVGGKYIFGGSVTESSASVVAAASALVSIGSLQGALFLNTSNTWQFTATNTAATLG